MKEKGLLNMLLVAMFALFGVGIVSCSDTDDDDENDGIDTTPISLTAGQEKTIQGADTITTQNKFVAYGKKNVVYAWHVGETSLVVNGKKTISIKVIPAYKLYDDPICKWGCDMNYVRNNQKQGTYSSKSTNSYLVYDNAGVASNIIYKFENGKLDAVTVFVSTTYTSQYADYLSERFLMLPYNTGKDTYFIGADNLELAVANTVVVLSVYNKNLLATVYMPANQYSTRSVCPPTSIDEKINKIIDDLKL